jgi:hypothetical protein
MGCPVLKVTRRNLASRTDGAPCTANPAAPAAPAARRR